MEQIIEKMQDEQIGVPVRTVKSFMTKIPSVFTGESRVLTLIMIITIIIIFTTHQARI